nr:CYP362A5 protein [Diaphanosoma celebensis]
MATPIVTRKSSYILNQFSRFHATPASLKQPASSDRVKWEDAKPFDQVPAAKRWPLIGTLWQMLPVVGIGIPPTNHVEFQEYQERAYGLIIRDYFPGAPPIVWIKNPDDVETVFRNEGNFPKRFGFDSVRKYREERVEYYTSTGLLFAEGEDWWKLRSKVQQSLLKPQNIYNYLPAINDIGHEFIDRIRLIRQENNEMKPDFLNELYRWALESVAVVAMNTRLGCLSPSLAPESEAQQIINAVNTTFTEVANLEMGLPIWKIVKTPALRRLFHAQDIFTKTSLKYINKTLEKIKNRPEGVDAEQTILEELLVRGMSQKDALVMIIDMLMAGIETTSVTVSFLFYLLAKNPGKQELLRKEVLSVVGPRGAPVTVDALNQLRYLKACVKESIRLMPAGSGVARILANDAVLSGYQVPKGTLAVIPVHYLCSKEEHFPKSREFIPERWIKGHEMESKPHPYVMVPFGFGRRMCPGRRLAEMEICQLTAKIVQNFQMKYHHEDISVVSRIGNIPDKPMRLTLVDL